MRCSKQFSLLRAILALCTVVLLHTAYMRRRTDGSTEPADNTGCRGSLPDRQQVTKRGKRLRQSFLPELLLYRNNETLRRFVQQMHSSGTMVELVNYLAKCATRLPQSYPTIDFSGYSFSSFDGKPLDTKRVISRLLLQLRTPQQPVTNVVHHYAMSDTGRHYQISFRGFVSLLSSLWLSGADLVIVWFNRQPGGRYWRLFLRNVTQSGVQERVMFGNRTIPHSVFGITLAHIENKVDVMKLEDQILLGGIFVDNDSVTVRSLQPLRRDSCVIGQDVSNRLCFATVVTAPANPFSIILYMMYQGYYPEQYDVFAMHLPFVLWKIGPNLCRVEKETMCKPTWQPEQMKLLYEDLSQLQTRWNWRGNYVVNVWSITKDHFPYPEANLQLETVPSAKSMFGQVASRILNGRSSPQ